MASFLEEPEMQPTVLDVGAVQQLFTELAFETNVVAILVRGKEGDAFGGSAPTLREARDVFLAGDAAGVQIRYLHRGIEWSETLMHTGAGIRRVRVKK